MILCTCGWGTLMANSNLPEFCPVCGFNLWEYFGINQE